MPLTEDDLDGAMNIREFADKINRSPDTVKRMIRKKEIETVRVGSGRGTIVITPRAYLDWLNRRRQPAQGR